MPLQSNGRSTASLYECVECQTHVRDPESRVCECGGYLKNIGVPRRK